MPHPFVTPKFREDAFNCPLCGAFADQEWFEIHRHCFGIGSSDYGPIENLLISICRHCNDYVLWRNGKMLYPSGGSAPMPNPDLPKEIKADYEEARNIVNQSPRGAAALLRLAIQKLCKHLGEKGKNTNADIGKLVKKGLPPKIQKSLDVVRVVGGQAVHPGVLDLKDDVKTAEKLFGLVNIICEVMISQPKSVDELYEEKIPPNQKKQIEERDS